MASSSLFPRRDPSSGLDPELAANAIVRLRAEESAAESATAQAVLLHEVAVLEEALGDEAAALRDHLSAVNADPDFHEPLERLIAIVGRRQSHKNLGRLLDRLVRVADGTEEKVRALLEQAAFLAYREANPAASLPLLQKAAEEAPEDAAVWFALELAAAAVGDAELRRRALAARAQLTQHSHWQALLLLDLARTYMEDDQADAALEALEQALDVAGPAAFDAWSALETLGVRMDRGDLVAQALGGQARLIAQALADDASPEASCVPQHLRTVAHAADRWLRAAEALQRRGDLTGAVALLDQALERLPDEAVLLYGRIGLAELLGDTETAAVLAQRQLQSGAAGGVAAGHWLRIAEAAAERGDATAALAAVTEAVRASPDSLPARGLQLDMLSGGPDPLALALALEDTGEQMSTDESKARWYVLAAEEWARGCADLPRAKAALARVEVLGASPALTARVGQLLAELCADVSWYDECTRRLAEAEVDEHERRDLLFELTRGALLANQPEEAGLFLSALASLPAGVALSRTLAAYALPLLESSRDSVTEAPDPHLAREIALGGLSELDLPNDTKRALRLGILLSAVSQRRDVRASQLLERLHADAPEDLVVASALAALRRTVQDAAGAAEVLTASAATAGDADARAALAIEAGVLFWQSQRRGEAIKAFTDAAAASPLSASALLSWALRAADPDTARGRRHALEMAEQSNDGTSLALERFALEAGTGGDGNAAEAALEEAMRAPGSELYPAALLARALWSASEADEDVQVGALRELADRYPSAAPLASMAAFHAALRRHPNSRSARDVLVAAERWAESDSSPEAALEWLASAMRAEDREAETAAREVLVQRLDPQSAPALHAENAMLAMLRGTEDQELIDSADPVVRLANLELALPTSEPPRRAQALQGLADLLGPDDDALGATLLGYNLLALGDIAGSIASFRRSVEVFPSDPAGWEGLRSAAKQNGDNTLLAEATAGLAETLEDHVVAAELWEQAGLLLIDELDEPERGERALHRAVQCDVRRTAAFDRLFRIVRARNDRDLLLELIAPRIEVSDDPDEIVKLYWERARVLRESGDRDGALAALESVAVLEPEHLGALALAGEIYITRGDFAKAARNLGQLAGLSQAPAKQRLMSGVAAADLYENKLEDLPSALSILLGLFGSGLSTLPVRERLARVAAKAQAWSEATRALEQLMQERPTREGRIEAARLCLVICRDRLDKPKLAQPAVEKLLEESPDDSEALELVLAGQLPPEVSARLLVQGRSALVEHLRTQPTDPERIARLARIALHQNDLPLRQATLGALVALGAGSPEIDAELEALDLRVAHVPQIAVRVEELPELADPEDTGPIAQLMREIAPGLAQALGPRAQTFGVTKADRVDPRSGLPLRNEIAAWAGALGVGDFDLFVGGAQPELIVAVPTEKPVIIVGAAVKSPLCVCHRQVLARELFSVVRGTSILRHRSPTDIAALVVAACHVGGHAVDSPPYAMLADLERQLGGRELPKRYRKALPVLGAAIVAEGQDPLEWVRAANCSLDRMATIAAGDVSHVLAGDGPRGGPRLSTESGKRLERVLAFALSPEYLLLRERLGMGVR
ncbi:MAG: hypothetical protein JW940_35540 [Polyangiaceae bacterium]|nr:hypothetical protein [Polyangiaceae bacterium]